MFVNKLEKIGLELKSKRRVKKNKNKTNCLYCGFNLIFSNNSD